MIDAFQRIFIANIMSHIYLYDFVERSCACARCLLTRKILVLLHIIAVIIKITTIIFHKVHQFTIMADYLSSLISYELHICLSQIRVLFAL